MLTDTAERWNASVRGLSRKLALAAACISILALAGHVAGIGGLTSVVVGWESLSIATAVAFLLLSLVLMRVISGWLCTALLIVAALLSGLVIGSNVLAGQDLISPFMATLLVHLGVGPGIGPLRMSNATAAAVLLIVTALFPGPAWPPSRLRNGAAGGALVIGLLAVVGFAYGPAEMQVLTPLRSMSLNSAISVLALATATILSDPTHGWAQVIATPNRSGQVTRRQLLYALLPAVLGLVLVRAMQSNHLPAGAAMALFVVLTIVPLLWLVLADGRTLSALDAERADRLRLVQRHGEDLQHRLDMQAEALSRSNAKLLAVAEAASERSEIRYRQLFDSIEAGFCVIELRFSDDDTPVDYRFVEINDAFERQTGLVDAAGKWVRDLLPEHERHWFDIYGQVARTGEPIRFENPANDLGDRWFDVYAFRIQSSEDLVGVLFNDISHRRTMEIALKAMNETLEQRVEAAIAERETAQEALRQSQKMEAIGQLTGGVAHDFNNLLTPIIGSLDLLTRRSGLGPREMRLIGAALQAAERAKVLVQRLLAFARRQPLQPGPVDLGALVAGMGELVASTSGPKIRVGVQVAPGVGTAIGDANQLEMAILNLCVNARDAMPDGGRLDLSVEPSGRPAEQPDLPEGAYVRLTVADDGTGMDADTIQRSIEPFFSTKGIGKGTGLGLSMVHGLAMQLGGALTIQSQPGLGTRISLYLRESGLAAVAAPAGMPATESAVGHILLIDDQEFVRATTADLLHEMGYTTAECDSAMAAELRLGRGERFDLVVTDHLMPGLSGAELAARLARDRPELPVLVISGYADTDELSSGLQVLRKPFREEELAAAIAVARRRVFPVGATAAPL